jgi:hypothetical protein
LVLELSFHRPRIASPPDFPLPGKLFFVFLPGDKLNIPVAGKKWYDGMLLH